MKLEGGTYSGRQWMVEAVAFLIRTFYLYVRMLTLWRKNEAGIRPSSTEIGCVRGDWIDPRVQLSQVNLRIDSISDRPCCSLIGLADRYFLPGCRIYVWYYRYLSSPSWQSHMMAHSPYLIGRPPGEEHPHTAKPFY